MCGAGQCGEERGSTLSLTATFSEGLCHQVWVKGGTTALPSVVVSDLGEHCPPSFGFERWLVCVKSTWEMHAS